MGGGDWWDRGVGEVAGGREGLGGRGCRWVGWEGGRGCKWEGGLGGRGGRQSPCSVVVVCINGDMHIYKRRINKINSKCMYLM